MNKKITFAQRVRSMQAVVENLREVHRALGAIVEVLQDEAEAMVEVQQRFEAKKPKAGAIIN